MNHLLNLLRNAARLRLTPAQSVYVGDHTLLGQSVYGGFIYLDARDHSLTPSIALRGNWESGVSKLFHQTVKPGMHVVDIGANCGFYTLIAIRRVGPGGRVLAIDANPRMTELIDRTLEANSAQGWARTICGAVSDKEGVLEFGIPGAYMGSASLLVKEDGRPEIITTFQAPAKTLDQWMEGDLRADVIKMDCEGAEPLIWTGSTAVRAANRRLTMFVEFAPPMLQHFQDPREFLGQIRSEGFAISKVEEVIGTHQPIDDASLLERSWTELMLTRAA